MSRRTRWPLSRRCALGILCLVLTALWTIRAGVVTSGIVPWPRQPPNEWARLMDTGDRLAGSGGTEPTAWGALSARTAYLLAFHHAQDSADASRMLIAAGRLERLGEHALAHCARQVAAWVAHSEPRGQGSGGDDSDWCRGR